MLALLSMEVLLVNKMVAFQFQNEKVVVLEELASRFRLKTPAVIERITELLQNETLSGSFHVSLRTRSCINDRGSKLTLMRPWLMRVGRVHVGFSV